MLSTILDEVQRDLQSARQADRVGAMQRLLERAKKDRDIWGEALPIFQAAVASEPDPSTAIYAARGVALVAGPEAARAAWLTLLDRPDPNTVANVAYAIDDPAYVPDLLQLLERRAELPIRHAVIRALGRSKDPRAFPVIVEGLAVPELRPDVVQALTDLGDPRAIPHLQTLLGDTTDAWPEDNHGPMLRVCDLAATAIARLGGVGSVARDDGRGIALTYAPALPAEARRRAGVLGDALMAIGGIVMSLGGVWLTFTGKSTEDRLAGIVGAILFGWCAGSGVAGLARARTRDDDGSAAWWFRLTPYLPLALAIVQAPWIVVSIMLLLFIVGDTQFRSTPENQRLFATLVALPSGLGVLCGMIIPFLGATRTLPQRVCFALGCALCAAFLFAVVTGRLR